MSLVKKERRASGGMVYTRHLKCRGRKAMWVRLPPSPPELNFPYLSALRVAESVGKKSESLILNSNKFTKVDSDKLNVINIK